MTVAGRGERNALPSERLFQVDLLELEREQPRHVRLRFVCARQDRQCCGRAVMEEPIERTELQRVLQEVHRLLPHSRVGRVEVQHGERVEDGHILFRQRVTQELEQTRAFLLELRKG